MNSFFFPSKQVKGQGLVEYAIILALVAIVVIAVLRILGPGIGNTFNSVNSSLDVAGGDGGSDGNDEGNEDLTAAQFDADLSYGQDPDNGCYPYTPGSNPNCDAIYERVLTCQGGSATPYCQSLQEFLDDHSGEIIIPGIND